MMNNEIKFFSLIIVIIIIYEIYILHKYKTEYRIKGTEKSKIKYQNDIYSKLQYRY